MGRLSRKVGVFVADYERQFERQKELARKVELLIRQLVEDLDADIHLVSARAKQPDSLRAKLREKQYVDPALQVTDTIAVRVITYYRSAVDTVTNALKREFEIDPERSEDKRRLLDLHEFGYRSVHLIARLKAPRSRMSEYADLAPVWFEIQVRSLLEHAWAEIEHEIVYKSGVRYPASATRLFGALAGTLEILDNEFENLRQQREHLIEHYRGRYSRGQDERKRMDVARLLGFLRSHFPESPTWGRSVGSSLPRGLDAACLEALATVGLRTAYSLKAALGMRRYRTAVQALAANLGQAPSGLSHLALMVLAVGLKDASVLQSSFPEIIRGPEMSGVLSFAGRRQVTMPNRVGLVVRRSRR
jgi:ppGpp synthetase/RelA/SpoT-type nucleotidyltranferase